MEFPAVLGVFLTHWLKQKSLHALMNAAVRDWGFSELAARSFGYSIYLGRFLICQFSFLAG